MLDRNGMAAAIEQVLTLPVRGAPRTIEPAKGDKGEAEFVQSVLMTPDQAGGMKTPISQLVGQITTAQIFRRSFFEKTFKLRESDGKIIYDKIAYRPPATCQARFNDRTGEGNGFRQQVWLFGGNLMLSSKQKVPGYVDIPKIRSYIYTHGQHREPLTGVSEMETAYWPWAHGTRVPTPDGWTVIEELRKGDLVFGVDGLPVRVTAIHPQGRKQMYRVTMRDGSSAECSADHLWGVYDTARAQGYRVMHTWELTEAGLRCGGKKPVWRFSVPRCQPVEYPERALPIDPYALGAWLGDGTMQRAADGISRHGPSLAARSYDGWIAGEVALRLPSDMKLVRSGDSYRFCPVVSRDTNPFRDALVGLGVNRPSGERFIPAIYLQASVKQRLDLLRGLMDTDGCAEGGNHARYHTKSPQLARDVRELVRSLGGSAIIRKIATRDVLRVEIQAEDCPFLLPAKVARWSRGTRRRASAIVSIEPTTEQECRCITVDRPDGLFLVNDYLTGHNCYSTMAKLLFLWMNFLEGMAMQRLVVYGNDQPEATARADDISQLRGSGVVGLVHPVEGQKTFEALPSASDAGAQFAACMTYLENWMASSVLAGFLQLSGAAAKGTRAGGGASAGSYGMSEDQSSYYLASREAVATEIADSISHDLIRPLVTLNFGASAAFPQWKFGPLQEAMTAVLFSMFGTMAAAPKLNVPLAFVDLLTERMAVILDLDAGQIHDALTSTANQRAEALAGNPPPGMPPEAAAGLGALQGIAQAGTGIAQAAAAAGRGPQGSPSKMPAAPAFPAPPGPPAPPPGKPPMAGGLTTAANVGG